MKERKNENRIEKERKLRMYYSKSIEERKEENQYRMNENIYREMNE